MKRRFFLLFMLLIAALMLCAAASAEERTETVWIEDFSHGADNKSMGRILQTETALEPGDVVRIDMSEVYAMYPEHTGVYGVLYTPGSITITETGKSSPRSVSGTGTLTFSFPGADGCELTGSGEVYAYFLPVAFRTLSTDSSLVNQAFDTDYVTETSVGHYNMFMLADPKVYVYQNTIPPETTVYKSSTVLGPLPQEYRHLEGYSGLGHYSFVSDQPVLVQCCAIRRSVYDTDSFCARPMEKIADNSDYEIWQYADYGAAGQAVSDRIRTVFDACMELADEEFIAEQTANTPVIMTLLREELAGYGMAGCAITDEMYDQIGFYSLIQLNTEAWEHTTDYETYLFAHEIGHVVHQRTLAYGTVSYASWYLEGFATFFGEKVCRRLGIDYTDHGALLASDIPALRKFYGNMVFGISDFEEYEAVGFDNSEVLMLPEDPYTFGCCFMEYLEETYGEGFFKGISRSFCQNWYQGHENRFFYRRNELDYNMDEFYRLIRAGLDDGVYTGFPAYAQQKYGLAVSADPDFEIPEGVIVIDDEAFAGIPASCIRVPDSARLIGSGAFADCPNLRQIIIPAGVEEISDGMLSDSGVIIVGEAGSAAQTYAEENGHPFSAAE